MFVVVVERERESGEEEKKASGEEKKKASGENREEREHVAVETTTATKVLKESSHNDAVME